MSNEREEVRARAFDLIFNLSVHSQLLVSADPPLVPQPLPLLHPFVSVDEIL